MRNRGYYSDFGGAYIPEILVATFDELVEHFDAAREDPTFWKSYVDLMASYSGRATPLTPAEPSPGGPTEAHDTRQEYTEAHGPGNCMLLEERLMMNIPGGRTRPEERGSRTI